MDTAPHPRRVSIVVPVFNSADGLRELSERLRPVVEAPTPRGCASSPLASAEVIFVNDGSRDESWSRIETIVRRFPWARGIDLEHNVGQHAALIAGASAASGEVIVTMDDDQQHPPESLGALLEPHFAHAGTTDSRRLVYGTPLDRGPLGARRMGSFLARAGLACRMRSRVALRSSAFRAFDASLVPGLQAFDMTSINLDVALVAVGATASAVSIPHEPSQRAGSRYSLGTLLQAGHAVLQGARARDEASPSAVVIRCRAGF